jgi:hypothetical protein
MDPVITDTASVLLVSVLVLVFVILLVRVVLLTVVLLVEVVVETVEPVSVLVVSDDVVV